ncbi:MAG: hypothetical protein LLF76_13385 [Planctomycetaceae bacterium]|nr:hypothetical protein [Planctomycetaceae bacterium]
MITEKTVLVLGAGASHAYGFPLGIELKDLIYAITQRPIEAYAPLIELGHTVDEIRNLGRALARSPVYSIDAFLERRAEFIELGKKIIAMTLLPYEHSVHLFENPIAVRSSRNKEFGSVEDWYQYLFNQLGGTLPELRQNQLVVITFNYDRSLEYYLYEAIRNSFNLDEQSLRDVMKVVQVIHVYGSLGRLHWQNGDACVIPYEAWNSSQGLKARLIDDAASSIKILHENPHNVPELKIAQEYIKSAAKVLFLGFGFNTTNLKRLLPCELIKRPNMYGTDLGLNVHQKREIHKIGMDGFRPDAIEYCFPNMKILDFLTQSPNSGLL